MCVCVCLFLIYISYILSSTNFPKGVRTWNLFNNPFLVRSRTFQHVSVKNIFKRMLIFVVMCRPDKFYHRSLWLQYYFEIKTVNKHNTPLNIISSKMNKELRKLVSFPYVTLQVSIRHQTSYSTKRFNSKFSILFKKTFK